MGGVVQDIRQRGAGWVRRHVRAVTRRPDETSDL